MLKALMTLTATISLATVAMAAEPIDGTWKRPSGTLIRFSPAGGDKHCGKVLDGEYAGKSIGCLSGSGAKYEGSINKLDEGKTYSGYGEVNGNSFKLSGCVLGGLICKSETLKRQ